MRSSFIVGFPGETEEDFEFLLDWLDEAQLDRVGCFKYEPVDGAPANALDATCPTRSKQDRCDASWKSRRTSPTGQLAKKVGRTIDVLVDEVEPENNRAIARSKWDAPEIDGQVFVNNATGIKPGDMVSVTVTDSDEYDLFAEPAPTLN